MQPDTIAKILVVDDNEANRLLAQDTLKDEGYEVVLADGGEEGLRVFDKELPDCVLLDVRMPDMDGFVVCERLRALPRGADTPILFLTGLRDVDTFDRALRAGGDDFLSKPIRPTEFLVRVQMALKLRRMNVELRDHYELLKRQRDALLRLQLQKERLMAFLVHDLKNPVNTMDLHAQVLLRDKDLTASARESAAQIRAEARNLTRMILNLLDISKADEGQLSPKRTVLDAHAFVGEVLSELAIMAEERGASLESAIEVDDLYADEDLLRRVLINLTENALRYAPAQTPVSISAAPVAGATELRVADCGRGVPPELHEKVFEPFLQLEAGDRLVHRTSRGLGLSFCKLAVEAHGGAIWIEDRNPGSVFCVRLPDGP
jgi:two-component system sensor histidine kinase/response regulator